MAEVEIELKEEELLDFDGSDCDFGSEEGFGEEDMDGAECGAQASNRDGAGNEEMAVAGSTGRMPEARNMKPRTELEDGELSDMAAMVNSKKQTEHGVVKDVKLSRKTSSATMRELSDREAERNGDSRHDRKRRKDHDYERREYSPRERKEPYDRHMGRYDRPYRSDRRHDRFGGLPDSRTRGRNAPGQNFCPNALPGIMGPGGPLRPDGNYQYRPSTAGLEIFSPAQLQELLNQEQILRRSQHQMMLQARFGIRPPGQALYPNFFRPPLPGTDLFMGPLHLQGARGNYPAADRGAGILGAAAFGFMGPSNTYTNDFTGPGRSLSRSGSGADQGKTSSRGPGEDDEFEEDGRRKHRSKEDSHARRAPDDHHFRRTRDDPESRRTQDDPQARRTQDDPQSRRTQDEPQSRRTQNDVESRRTRDDPESRRIRDDLDSRRAQDLKRTRDGDLRHDRDMERRPRSSSERESGDKAHSAAGRGNDHVGNFIHLGGPVTKSRVLTVSGFLENTPMSSVAEAFEKQGKILDFRKNQKGDVFTVTFSSVQEALSAKRHLHRSIIAGRQITVDYAV